MEATSDQTMLFKFIVKFVMLCQIPRRVGGQAAFELKKLKLKKCLFKTLFSRKDLKIFMRKLHLSEYCGVKRNKNCSFI